MRLQLVSVILSVVLTSSLVSASPVPQPDSKTMSPAKGKSVGAAYFLTNEPNGNFVVAADIGTDGKLNLRRAIDAGGLGAHGQPDNNGPDGLFSQGSIKASKSGKVLVTVNPGSSTLSSFKIDPNDPTALRMIGKPVSSDGQFPISVALNKDGNMACAVNGGAINGVSCYSIDQQKGLVPIQNTVRSLGLNQTTPATGPAGSASQVVFTEDGNRLVVSVKGVPPQPGFFAVWDVQADGSLSENFQSIAPAKGGLLPFSMTVIPGKNAIFATDAGIGFDIFDLAAAGSSQGQNSTATGDRSSSNAIDGQVATCWSTFSPSTGNFYLTDIGTSTITEVNLDDNLAAKIVKQYPQTQQSATIDLDIASVGSTDFLYVLAANATTIDVLSLDGPGQANNVQKLDISGPARAAGLQISGSNLQGMTVFLK
ncbi:hypothetical protein D9756_003435 [Leucocoprinus leucothites]|uniref:3-carboxymuconate cyclase n=1 Tax=Leucocoprinus leucothites TaxID=201217 RepID=A0A8H5G7I8_9AGAR|nr:hypothetical protein D9756_011557 [Leucoagaricus leucothites]KAF5359641.1 hypothetical protein D9756_003435 [Leucoagaricus leucothites]